MEFRRAAGGRGSTEMAWFEKLLCKLFRYLDITKDVEGVRTLYLRRWFLVDVAPPKEAKPKRLERLLTKVFGKLNRVCLHKICRSDDDRDPHDHPWDFWTLILAGGYWDEQWMRWEDPLIGSQGRVGPEYQDMRVGNIAFRPAEHLHRVQIPPKRPAWTLVWMKKPRRGWGFVTETGQWIGHRQYLKEGEVVED